MTRRLRLLLCVVLAGLVCLPAAAPAASRKPKRAAAKAATRAPIAAKSAAPAAPVAPANASRAVLGVTEPAFDFGTVMEGEPLEHVFEVRNSGPDELLIASVKPG